VKKTLLGALICALGSGALATVHAATPQQQARILFFGVDGVDADGELPKDKVIFSWLSNSSYAASIGGRVVLLDTGVARLETTAGRTPFVLQDLVDLKPEAIFIGHGHSAQADNAAYLAAKTGATVYAAPETCASLQADFTRLKGNAALQADGAMHIEAASLNCVSVGDKGATVAGGMIRVNALEPLACINAVRHLHSTPVAADTDLSANSVPIEIDPRDAELFPTGTPLKPAAPGAQAGQFDITTGGDSRAGTDASLLFHFTLRSDTNFSFAWHDTTGPLKEGASPGKSGDREAGLRLQALLRQLPATDLHLGAVPSENIANNGMRDLVMYQQALQPLIFVPNHHTAGPGSPESSSVPLYASYLRQLQLMAIDRSEWADIRWTTDPTSYAKPIKFDIGEKAWARAGKTGPMASHCEPVPPTSSPEEPGGSSGGGGGSLGLAGALLLGLGSLAMLRRRKYHA